MTVAYFTDPDSSEPGLRGDAVTGAQWQIVTQPTSVGHLPRVHCRHEPGPDRRVEPPVAVSR